MSWEKEVREIQERADLARRMGGEERVARHHAAGKLTVRERVDQLVDPYTFRESGTLAGRAEYDGDRLVEFTPSNFVMGRALINGRPVVVGGDDFTVRGGANDGAVGNKMGYSELLARELRVPLIRLVDGTGGGGSVKTIDDLGRTYVPALPGWEVAVQLLSEVPVVGAAMGSVAGLGAARVVASHFSLMIRGTSQVFVAGPPVVERGMGQRIPKEELGGSEIHAHGNGVVDNEVASEAEAFDQIRQFLSYLPSSVWEAPPHTEPDDKPNRREEGLISIIPRNRRMPYDVRKILEWVFDRESLFEIGRFQGRPLVTALGPPERLPRRRHGQRPEASRRRRRRRCLGKDDPLRRSLRHLSTSPSSTSSTIPASSSASKQKRKAPSASAPARFSPCSRRHPWISIILRRVYGVAGAGHARQGGINLRYAWPSGDWGSLPIEGGVQAAFRREIEAAESPEQRRAELEAHFEGFARPSAPPRPSASRKSSIPARRGHSFATGSSPPIGSSRRNSA
jgi:acetyl-CoA carboxylase carboxyltransferase component